MRDYTHQRHASTPDQIWLLEHEPVYTLGRAASLDHVLHAGEIPLVHCDRGGQVTYHGPGQLVAYILLDLRRYGLYAKEYVRLLEQVTIDVLGTLNVMACRKPGSPGVYVPQIRGGADVTLAKIGALGVKISNGCTYHGLAINVAMDLQPFAGILPCGQRHTPTIDLRACGVAIGVQDLGDRVAQALCTAIKNYQRQPIHEEGHDTGNH